MYKRKTRRDSSTVSLQLIRKWHFSPSPLAGEGGGEGGYTSAPPPQSFPVKGEEDCWLFSWFEGALRACDIMDSLVSGMKNEMSSVIGYLEIGAYLEVGIW